MKNKNLGQHVKIAVYEDGEIGDRIVDPFAVVTFILLVDGSSVLLAAKFVPSGSSCQRPGLKASSVKV